VQEDCVGFCNSEIGGQWGREWFSSFAIRVSLCSSDRRFGEGFCWNRVLCMKVCASTRSGTFDRRAVVITALQTKVSGMFQNPSEVADVVVVSFLGWLYCLPEIVSTSLQVAVDVAVAVVAILLR
jgi:hypothetical protein